VTPDDARVEGASRGLIGRDAELRAAVAAFDGDDPLAVVGEAGIGKTSLVRAAAPSGERSAWA
jgi:MoxR-like ATPase